MLSQFVIEHLTMKLYGWLWLAVYVLYVCDTWVWRTYGVNIIFGHLL